MVGLANGLKGGETSTSLGEASGDSVESWQDELRHVLFSDYLARNEMLFFGIRDNIDSIFVGISNEVVADGLKGGETVGLADGPPPYPLLQLQAYLFCFLNFLQCLHLVGLLNLLAA